MSTAHANRQTTTCCSCCISLLSFRMGSNYLNDNFFLSLEGIEGGGVCRNRIKFYLSRKLLYFVSLAGRNVVELIRTNGKFPSVFSNVNRKPWFGKEFNVVETRTTADLEPLRRSGHTRPNKTKQKWDNNRWTWIASRKPWKFRCQKVFESLLVSLLCIHFNLDCL